MASGPFVSNRGGLFSPIEIASAWRQEHPGKFDDITDHELIAAIETEDPDTYKLIDPLLIGAEVLTSGPRPKPTPRPLLPKGARRGGVDVSGTPALPEEAYPLPTVAPQMPTAGHVVSTGIRVVPSLAGAALGTYLAPGYGSYAGGSLGAGLGETGAQFFEKALGTREEISPGVVATESALGAFNPVARGATVARRIAQQGLVGGGFAGASQTARSLIEEGRWPTPEELALAVPTGMAFGAATHGAFEGAGALTRAAERRVPDFGDFTGALPTPPPVPMSPQDQLVVARAAAAMYEQEEARLAKGLTDAFGEKALQGRTGDFHTALEMKDYLGQLADLGQPPVAIPPLVPGIQPAAPQRLLGRGQPDFMAYPPEALVEPLDRPPSAIVGGRQTGDISPLSAEEAAGRADLGQVLDQMTGAGLPPGAPPPGPAFALRPPPGPPAPGALPRQPSLVEPPRPLRTPRAIEMEGPPPGPIQPRLRAEGEPQPGYEISTPRPSDRVYATGPNAGPRREGEMHGQPRPLRRQIKRAGKTEYETYASTRPAEDPATWDPEVRREVARIAHELEIIPYVKVSGGTTTKQLADMVQSGVAHDTSDAIRILRQQGLTSGGATAGAPVYHDIIKAAEGSFKHTTRGDMLRMIREALLEGKGNALTDAAAVVARQRAASEASGRPLKSIRSKRGEGDFLIGWTDEATGETVLPPQAVDEWTRTAREAEDSELLAAVRARAAGSLNESTRPLFDAAAEEAVRRGLIEPEQLDLIMEGPGGAKGPRLFDFEGEPPAAPTTPLSELTGRRKARALANAASQEELPPPPPTSPEQAARNAKLRAALAAEGKGGGPLPEPTPALARIPHEMAGLPGLEAPPPPSRPEQPTLPGAEGVREQNIPTPQVADLPFALAPPPAAPSPKPVQGALRRFFEDEAGVLILDVPAGDRSGLKKWLKRQEDQHGGEAWYARVEQAIDDGDWDRAWKAAASASVRSYNKAYEAASPQEADALERAVKGTVLQQDLPAQIVAVGRAGQQKRPAPTVPDLPPSYKVTVRQGGQGMTLGPAGLIQPGAPTMKPPRGARAETLDREIMDSFVDAVSDTPELIHLVRNNRDAALRLGRQVTDLVVQGQVKFDPAAFPGMTREEVGRQYMHTLSEAGRILGAHGRYVQDFSDELHQVADRMDMGAALAGTLTGGRRPVMGSRGRPLSKGAAVAMDKVAQQTRTPEVTKSLLQNDLARPPKRSTGELLMDSQYAFLTSGVATALRNTYTTAARYGWDLLDQALQYPLSTILGERASGRMAGALLRERVGARHTSFAVTPLRAMRAETFEEIYNLNAATLSAMSDTDARRVLKILSEYPDEAAHMIGWAGGEELAREGSSSTILNTMLSPKVQRFLTLWNRAQEFTGRALTLDTHFRAQIRSRGLDPVEVLRDPSRAALAEKLGGDRAVEEMLRYASNAALEMTWAGQLANRSIPGALVKMVQDHWPAKLVQRFPRFNFSAAPRWIYDHSPAALLDLVRLPFDRAGWTSTGKNLGGGRLYRGLKSQEYQTDVIPALRSEITQAEGRLGDAVLELQGTHREWAVRQRQVANLEARMQRQAQLPGLRDRLQEATAARDQLARRRDALTSRLVDERHTVQDLKAQEGKLWSEVQNATGISAPTWSSWMARMTSGTFGLLGAAVVMRSQPGLEGTRFFQYPIEREGKDPYMLDLRSAAPFVQYLAVADVMVDFWRHTNWEGLQAEMDQSGESANPLAWQRALWNHYEGKYTTQLLGAEFAQAFLSISRAAGTTLTIADLMTRNGWPGPSEAADAIVGTIGQFLAGYATPLGQFKDIAGQFSEEEATVRTTPRPSLQDPASWSYPLAEGLGRVPVVNRLLPPVLSQTTGRELKAVNPAARALTGIGGSPADFIQEETRRIGLPGSTLYFRETGDRGFDVLVTDLYSRLLTQELPAVFESEEYQQLRSPANQRDFLQQIIPRYKRAALAEAKALLGLERVEGVTVRGEEARRKARRLRLIQDLEGPQPEDQTPTFEEEPTPAPPPPLPPG